MRLGAISAEGRADSGSGANPLGAFIGGEFNMADLGQSSPAECSRRRRHHDGRGQNLRTGQLLTRSPAGRVELIGFIAPSAATNSAIADAVTSGRHLA